MRSELSAEDRLVFRYWIDYNHINILAEQYFFFSLMYGRIHSISIFLGLYLDPYQSEVGYQLHAAIQINWALWLHTIVMAGLITWFVVFIYTITMLQWFSNKFSGNSGAIRGYFLFQSESFQLSIGPTVFEIIIPGPLQTTPTDFQACDHAGLGWFLKIASPIQCVPQKRKPINQVNFSENWNYLSEKVYIVTKFSLSSFFWHQLQDVLAMHDQARTISNDDVRIDLRRIGI